MKRILNKKLFVLILAAALLLGMTLVLSGCSSKSKPVKTASAVRFDDTEILKSPLTVRRGNWWSLTGCVKYASRNEAMACNIYLLGNNTHRTPVLEVALITNPSARDDDVHPDTPTALRVIIGGTCYSFRHLTMDEIGYAGVPCGLITRSMLSDLAGCDSAVFEVDYKQYGTGKESTFTATISRAKLSEWRQMGTLLENSHLWEVADPFFLDMNDDYAAVSRR